MFNTPGPLDEWSAATSIAEHLILRPSLCRKTCGYGPISFFHETRPKTRTNHTTTCTESQAVQTRPLGRADHELPAHADPNTAIQHRTAIHTSSRQAAWLQLAPPRELQPPALQWPTSNSFTLLLDRERATAALLLSAAPFLFSSRPFLLLGRSQFVLSELLQPPRFSAAGNSTS